MKLDFGCGKNPREGFEGVDILDFGQPWKVDINEPWPWEDGSVEEAHASHFIEHLDAAGRIHFVNELYRVLKPGGQCMVITPHWNSARAYGDLTHKWPPVSEFWFYYLSKEWREQQAPHNVDYTCNFGVTWGYTFHPGGNGWNPDRVQYAIAWFKEYLQDTVATLTKVE